MKPNLRFQFSLGEFVILVCAAIMLVAFFAMPWYELEDGSTVTGAKLAGDTEGDLELPVRISHMFSQDLQTKEPTSKHSRLTPKPRNRVAYAASPADAASRSHSSAFRRARIAAPMAPVTSW